MRRRRGRGERKARSAESQVAFFFGPRLPKDIECAKLASRARHSENGRWEHRAVGGGGGGGARRSERQGLVQAGGGLDLLGFRLPRAEQIGRGGVSLKLYADGHPVDGQRSKYEG